MRYPINLVLALVVCLFGLVGCDGDKGNEQAAVDPAAKEQSAIDPAIAADPMRCGEEDPELKKLAGPVKDGFPGMPDHPGKIEIFLRPDNDGMINALRCMMTNDWTRAMLRDPRTDIIVVGPSAPNISASNSDAIHDENDRKYFHYADWMNSANSLTGFARWLKKQGMLDLSLEFLINGMDSFSDSDAALKNKLSVTLYEARFTCHQKEKPFTCHYIWFYGNGGVSQKSVSEYYNLVPEDDLQDYLDRGDVFGEKIKGYGDVNNSGYIEKYGNSIYYYKTFMTIYNDWLKDMEAFVAKHRHPVFGKDMQVISGLFISGYPTKKELGIATPSEKNRAFVFVNGKFDPLFMERLRLMSPNPECRWEADYYNIPKDLLKLVPRPKKSMFSNPKSNSKRGWRYWVEFPNISKNAFFFPGIKIGELYYGPYPMFWEHEEWVVYPYNNWDRVSVEE